MLEIKPRASHILGKHLPLSHVLALKVTSLRTKLPEVLRGATMTATGAGASPFSYLHQTQKQYGQCWGSARHSFQATPGKASLRASMGHREKGRLATYLSFEGIQKAKEEFTNSLRQK